MTKNEVLNAVLQFTIHTINNFKISFNVNTQQSKFSFRRIGQKQNIVSFMRSQSAAFCSRVHRNAKFCTKCENPFACIYNFSMRLADAEKSLWPIFRQESADYRLKIWLIIGFADYLPINRLIPSTNQFKLFGTVLNGCIYLRRETILTVTSVLLTLTMCKLVSLKTTWVYKPKAQNE